MLLGNHAKYYRAEHKVVTGGLNSCGCSTFFRLDMVSIIGRHNHAALDTWGHNPRSKTQEQQWAKWDCIRNE